MKCGMGVGGSQSERKDIQDPKGDGRRETETDFTKQRQTKRQWEGIPSRSCGRVSVYGEGG